VGHAIALAGAGGVLFYRQHLKTMGAGFLISGGVLFFISILSCFLSKESTMKSFLNLFKTNVVFYTEPNPLEMELNQLSLSEQMILMQNPHRNKKLYNYLLAKQASSQESFNAIMPNLFLGNRQAGYRTFEKILGKQSTVKFNSVVTVFRENTINEYHTRADDLNEHHDETMPVPLYPALKENEHFCHFPLDDIALDDNVDDSSFYQLLAELDQTVQFITHRLALDENVLVHCNQGASRSATIVVAYLMKAQHLPLEEAINHVKHCRPCVDVSNFKLLKVYEQNLQLTKESQEEKITIPQASI